MFFLGEMAFVICGDTTHMGQIILVILGRVFLRILLQNLDDLPPAAAIRTGDQD